jgi:alkaline phosphatase
MRVIANHQLGLAELNTMHPVVGYAKLDTETVMLVTADHLAACVNGGTAPASYGAQPREARTAVSMYRRTHAQSEKAKAIGDARPFVCAAAPAKGMLVCLIAEEDWQAVQEALREEWSSSDG